jgi:hypothetical protein
MAILAEAQTIAPLTCQERPDFLHSTQSGLHLGGGQVGGKKDIRADLKSSGSELCFVTPSRRA